MYTIIKKEKYTKEYGLNSRGLFTPFYFSNGKSEHFISNLVTGTDDIYKSGKQNRWEMAIKIKNLRANNYKFICFYGGRFNNPIDFLDYVIKEKKTIEIHGELFLECDSFTDFHGNLREVSCAFMFRIYDKDYLQQIKKLAARAKKHYHYQTKHSKIA